MKEVDDLEICTDEVWAVLSLIAKRDLTRDEFDALIESDDVWQALDTDAFAALVEHVEFEDTDEDEATLLPPSQRNYGGGKNHRHAKRDPNKKMPAELEAVEREIEQVINENPPQPNRKQRLKKLRDRRKHIRDKGGWSGDEHSRIHKGPPRGTTREEIEDED